MSMRAHDPGIELVELAGELDVSVIERVAERLDRALAGSGPVVVDLTECAFVDLTILRALHDAYRAAADERRRFVVLLPFGAASVVRVLLLELVPDLAPYPIVPSRASARGLLGRRATTSPPIRPDPLRFRELRARAWDLLRRQEELLARRDALILEARTARALRQGSATASGDAG